MTMRLTACAMAVALLAGTASFSVPAIAQSASSHTKKLFLSADAIYDAGVRRGTAKSYRSAYVRGFRDGRSSGAYSSLGYVRNSNPGIYIPSVSGNPAYNLWSGAYSDGRYVSYNNANGYMFDRYDAGYARMALASYCTARYQSFDPASGTFLAYDGNRYLCR
jgi:hypothetical protein